MIECDSRCLARQAVPSLDNIIWYAIFIFGGILILLFSASRFCHRLLLRIFFSADLLLYSFGGNPCLVSWKPLNLITSALTKSVYTRLYLKRYSRSLASVGRLYEITQWMYCEPVKETCYSRDTAIMIWPGRCYCDCIFITTRHLDTVWLSKQVC